MTYRLAILALALSVQYARATMSRQTIAEYVLRATARHGPRRAAREELAQLDEVVRARRLMGLRPGVVSGAIPRVLAQCSNAREEEVSSLQARVRTGPTGPRHRPGPDALDCAARSVGRATQLWRIGSYANSALRMKTLELKEVEG